MLLVINSLLKSDLYLESTSIAKQPSLSGPDSLLNNCQLSIFDCFFKFRTNSQPQYLNKSLEMLGEKPSWSYGSSLPGFNAPLAITRGGVLYVF